MGFRRHDVHPIPPVQHPTLVLCNVIRPNRASADVQISRVDASIYSHFLYHILRLLHSHDAL
jgi:hypothetical protein